MPYRFLEQEFTADVGFIATGTTLEECFTAAADAVLEVMLANPRSLRSRQRRTARVHSEDLDLALLKFLEELVYFKDAERLLLRPTHIAVVREEGQWTVEAALAGEPIDSTRHELSADVKAVTLHRLNVRRTKGGWEATVVLDI